MIREIAEPPVTIEVSTPEEKMTLIHEKAWLDNADGQIALWWSTAGDTKRLIIDQPTTDVPGRLESTTAESGYPIVVRHTDESDVEAADGFSETIPLPIPVIAASLRGGNMATDLYALVGDDGMVKTVLLSSDVGMFLRYSGAWHDLSGSDVVDGLSSVEIQPGGLDLYDSVDQAGQQVAVTSMPVVDDTDRALYADQNVPVAPEAENPPSTTASIPMPTIETARDAATAIEIADQNPQFRWYVERRLEALGLSLSLPWEDRNA